MLQSHSQAFVIASKTFNAPSGYVDNGQTMKKLQPQDELF